MANLSMIIVACAIMCVFTSAETESTAFEYTEDMAEIDAIYQELPCAMQGGQCVKQEDCPHITAVKGLCTAQRSQGVECCYGISKKETRCGRRGGECVHTGNCPAQLSFYGASDCPEESVCCVLVE